MDVINKGHIKYPIYPKVVKFINKLQTPEAYGQNFKKCKGKFGRNHS